MYACTVNTRHRQLTLVGSDGVAAGSNAGEQERARLLSILSNQPAPVGPEVVYIDFGDIEVATVSWIREAVFALADEARRRWPHFCPAIGACGSDVAEEVEVAAIALSRPIPAPAHSTAHGIGMFGQLDQVQLQTLQRVSSLGPVSAPDLMNAYPECSLQAWNNRLRSLSERGLLLTEKRGRERWYDIVRMEVPHGC